MQVIGLCRFSYPAEGGFQVEHGSTEDRMSYLYAPERMEERFRMFEAFTLPALRGQTDDDFHFAIVIGDSLPPVYRERLEALVADVPQIRIIARAPGPHRRVMQEVINDLRTAKGPSLQFRLDDDDAVAVSYVEQLRMAARDTRGLLRNHRHVAIDFNQGLAAQAGADGIAAAPMFIPYLAVALALMVHSDLQLTVMNFAHTKLNRRMPTVTLTGQDMFVRGHNTFNDSRQKENVTRFNMVPLDDLGEAHFRTTFNIDSDHVRRIYAPDRATFSR